MSTVLSAWDTVAAGLLPREHKYATPGELARAIEPATIQTPALDLIDQALVELANTPDGRLIITMPPQEGKSKRVAGDFPLWSLLQRPRPRIVDRLVRPEPRHPNGRGSGPASSTGHPRAGAAHRPRQRAVRTLALAGTAAAYCPSASAAG
jgi:hypothetical protein